jgi:hypothetical protein
LNSRRGLCAASTIPGAGRPPAAGRAGARCSSGPTAPASAIPVPAGGPHCCGGRTERETKRRPAAHDQQRDGDDSRGARSTHAAGGITGLHGDRLPLPARRDDVVDDRLEAPRLEDGLGRSGQKASRCGLRARATRQTTTGFAGKGPGRPAADDRYRGGKRLASTAATAPSLRLRRTRPPSRESTMNASTEPPSTARVRRSPKGWAHGIGVTAGGGALLGACLRMPSRQCGRI